MYQLEKFSFQQLNTETRAVMLDELERDQAANRVFQSQRMTYFGLKVFPKLLKHAFQSGDEYTLSQSLRPYMKGTETYHTRNGPKLRRIPKNAHQVLGEGQFNIYYSRAICRIALEQGDGYVQAYRAKSRGHTRPESEALIGQKIPAQQVLEDLRNSDFSKGESCFIKPNTGISFHY